jgi:hypothetical protein
VLAGTKGVLRSETRYDSDILSGMRAENRYTLFLIPL